MILCDFVFLKAVLHFAGMSNEQVLSPTNTYDLPNTIWGARITNEEVLKSTALIHMDDDDIFQVDESDLIQGKTMIYKVQ